MIARALDEPAEHVPLDAEDLQMTVNGSGDAVQDADLIRWLDGELEEEERRRIDRALAADPALEQRLEQLRVRRRQPGAFPDARKADAAEIPASWPAPPKIIELNAAWAAQQGVEPHVVRPPRAIPWWLRALVVLVLLLAASLLLPPVRAFLAHLLRLAN